MGSTIITLPETFDQTSLFGTKKPLPVYLQFVPGIVISVSTSTESGIKGITNSILAQPHYSQKLKHVGLGDEENRYVPLLRGSVDVPVAGDPVLLCTIGGIQYYLGPLNTEGSPTFNIDHLYKGSTRSDYSKKATASEVVGISENFIRDPKYTRLQKTYNEELDNPRGDKKNYNDIHGDMVHEGRHGNSIRIGSRDVNPYLIISNGRNYLNRTESMTDGSLIGMFSRGTIHQHFPKDSKLENDTIVDNPFVLASDTVEKPTKLMSDLVSNVNGGDSATDLIYKYDAPQLIQTSDRIIINSKKDSLFLSAFKHVHIGAGESITFSSNVETVFESTNIYIGKQAKESEQGLVLGENLRALLEELVDILLNANGHCQGAPVPLGTQNGPPGSLQVKLQNIKKALSKNTTDFVSSKHFIEIN